MSKSRLGLGVALLGVMIAISACDRSTSESTDAPISSTATTSTESSSAASERVSKAEAMAEFETLLEQARATQGPGSPALWRLSDDDTTIHMFGTVHMLRPELQWRTEQLDQAMAEADKIVFEVDMSSPEALRRITTDFQQRGMFEDGRSLKQVLNDEDELVIAAAFDSIGVPIEAMDTFEPWMASINLGMMKLMNDGYDPESGVESVIEADAKGAGKSFAYLEDISQQTDAFDLLPEDEQINMLYQTALFLDESPEMLDLLVDEWADGDVAGISTLVANPDGQGFTEAAYDSVLVQRNAAWVPQIEAMLDEPGTVFIAVGAGHFAGPDSVIKMLRDKGYEVEGP